VSRKRNRPVRITRTGRFLFTAVSNEGYNPRRTAVIKSCPPPLPVYTTRPRRSITTCNSWPARCTRRPLSQCGRKELIAASAGQRLFKIQHTARHTDFKDEFRRWLCFRLLDIAGSVTQHRTSDQWLVSVILNGVQMSLAARVFLLCLTFTGCAETLTTPNLASNTQRERVSLVPTPCEDPNGCENPPSGGGGDGSVPCASRVAALGRQSGGTTNTSSTFRLELTGVRNLSGCTGAAIYSAWDENQTVATQYDSGLDISWYVTECWIPTPGALEYCQNEIQAYRTSGPVLSMLTVYPGAYLRRLIIANAIERVSGRTATASFLSMDYSAPISSGCTSSFPTGSGTRSGQYVTSGVLSSNPGYVSTFVDSSYKRNPCSGAITDLQVDTTDQNFIDLWPDGTLRECVFLPRPQRCV
jgi:hypothetical protein